MSDDNSNEDTQQVSVAELLARNGAKVGNQSGGRRRRGMAGGISVAELTGEIPVVEDSPTADAPAAKTETPRPDAPRTESPKSESTKPETPKPETPKPRATEAARRPSAPARPTPAFGSARTVEPEPALFSGAPSVAVDRLRASTDRSADTEAVEKPAARTVEKPAAKPAEKTAAKTAEKTVEEPAATSADTRDVDASSETTVLTPVTADDEAVTTETAVVTDADGPATDTHDTDTPDTDTPATDTHDTAEPARPAGSKRSPIKQWLSLFAQGAVAIVLGAFLFKGFERLWEMLPWVALVLAFFVIVGLVAVVRVLRRTDDIVSILLAVLVGGFVTLGPLAFMLSTT